MGLTLLHAFCRLLLFVFAMFCFVFLKKLAFSKKNILGKQLKCQTAWAKIRLSVSSSLIRVQTVYNRLSPDDTDRQIVKQKLIIIARVCIIINSYNENNL